MVQKMMTISTTRAELKRKVLYFSICSRLFVLFLSFISNVVLPDHDAGVYKFPRPVINESIADQTIDTVLRGLSSWDAQHFLHISLYGYTYEHTLAFFPLFAFLTRTLSHALHILLGSLFNQLSLVLISAVLINLFFFVKSSIILFELSCFIFQNDAIAYVSALFFCINPASVFFTAIYSESCFSFFTFAGMLFCVKNGNGLLSCLSLGLSGCTRSNGIVNFGFLVHKSLKYILHFIDGTKNICSVFHITCFQLSELFIYAVILFAPFVGFQIYAYSRFCFGDVIIANDLKEFGELKGFVMPGSEIRPWCNFTMPLSYSYVQSHYWTVGFFKYYELKKIPNFLLALPVVYIVLGNSYSFMLQNKLSLISLGFSRSSWVRFQGRDIRPEFLVFVVHAVFLTIFCLIFVHVEVTTRMIASSSPVLYWFLAMGYKCTTVSDVAITSRLHSFRNSRKYSAVESQDNMNSLWKNIVLTEKPADLWSYFVRSYCYFYLFIGTALFSNFYPWT